MARKKSIQDIQSQVKRMFEASKKRQIDLLNSGAMYDGSVQDMKFLQRRKNITNIGQRYVDNIMRSSTFKKSVGTNIPNSALERKYSQRVYMGRVNG